MLITGDNLRLINHLKAHLNTWFQVKDLGDLRYFLGLEIKRSKHGIFLSQRKYVMDLLHASGLFNSKPVYLPMDPNTTLSRAFYILNFKIFLPFPFQIIQCAFLDVPVHMVKREKGEICTSSYTISCNM